MEYGITIGERNGVYESKISEILLVVPMPIWNAKFVSAANF